MEGSDNQTILADLNAAVQSGDADAVEDAISHAYEVGLNREFVPAFIALLSQPSHICHEDIVQALQSLKDPRSVDALFQAALHKHDYLSFDKAFGLARRCTWALADIGTPDARSGLEVLAKNFNPQIAAFAQKRLDGWANERHRKGA